MRNYTYKNNQKHNRIWIYGLFTLLFAAYVTAAGNIAGADARQITNDNQTEASELYNTPEPVSVPEKNASESNSLDFPYDESEYKEEEDGETYDGQLVVPGNVRMDRLSLDVKVSPPLKSARVSSLFGYRENPVTGKFKFHTGLDLAAPQGDPIYAMLGGTVTTAGFDSGYGNYIIINHKDGLQTLYGHCSKLLCKKGEEVGKGQKIALVGSTGNSSGPHLHAEIRKDGQRYDPEWILGGMY